MLITSINFVCLLALFIEGQTRVSRTTTFAVLYIGRWERLAIKRETRACLGRLLSLEFSKDGNIRPIQTYLHATEVRDGNGAAGRTVCAADDAQELGVHDGGGAVPDAWDWSDDGDLYGGERRTASAIAVRASRAAGSSVHRVSYVSERRAAPLLDFRAGIHRFEARHALLGVTGCVGHGRSKSCWQNATCPGYRGLFERRTAGDAWRCSSHGTFDCAIGRCAGSPGSRGPIFRHLAGCLCRRSKCRGARNAAGRIEVHDNWCHAKGISISARRTRSGTSLDGFAAGPAPPGCARWPQCLPAGATE